MDDDFPALELPAHDVTMLDAACSSDLDLTFLLRQHEPMALPLQCVAGEALFGCAAPPAPGAERCEAEGGAMLSSDAR